MSSHPVASPKRTLWHSKYKNKAVEAAQKIKRETGQTVNWLKLAGELKEAQQGIPKSRYRVISDCNRLSNNAQSCREADCIWVQGQKRRSYCRSPPRSTSRVHVPVPVPVPVPVTTPVRKSWQSKTDMAKLSPVI